jgi:branched-chain amino acid transport system permease protein
VAIDVSLADVFGVRSGGGEGGFLSDIWGVTVAQLAPILPYLFLILVLIFRPTGLMGTRET